MQKENSPRSSFLHKFEGKNQKINRDGLLQMLNHKLPIQTNSKNPMREYLQFGQYQSNILKQTSSRKHAPSLKKNIFSSVELIAPKSQRALDKMAFHLIKQSSDKKGFEQSNHFKLPAINRSKSQNGNIKNGFVERDIIESQISNKIKSNSGSFYSKNSDKLTKKMELDQYILRHLEFLNKFQKKLINTQKINGQETGQLS